jgi:hypothetical protein
MKFSIGASLVTKFKFDGLGSTGSAGTLKEWVMVLLTMAFVALYGLALVGKLKPLADLTMVSRLEPMIFVIIGYYFGRLPAQQNEQTLREEIDRQTKRADAAQQARETALQSREALDEKLKNARTALSSVDGGPPGASDTSKTEKPPHGSVAAAFNILSS